MNEDYKAMLKKEIIERLKAISKMVPGTEESKNAIDEVCKLIDRYNKIEELQNHYDIQYKKTLDEICMKEKEIENDKWKFLIDVGVNIGKFVGAAAFTAFMSALWTAFEKDDHPTFSMTKEMVKKSLSFFKLS